MKAWIIAGKDLTLLTRDLRALSLLIAFPLIFITIIGLTTGPLLGLKNETIHVRYVDQLDYSKISDPKEQKLARNLVMKVVNKIQARTGVRIVALAEDEADTKKQLEEGKFDAVLIFGPDFFTRFQDVAPEDLIAPSRGKLADGLTALDLHLEHNPGKGENTRSLVEQFVWGDTLSVMGPHIFCGIRTRDILVNAKIRQNCKELDDELNSPPIEFQVPDDTKKEASVVYQELIPSYTVMFVFFLVNIMARSFLEERALGTMRRLRMAPVAASSLLIGKTAPFFIISVVQTAILFLAGRLIFGMSWGTEPWLLIPVILCTSLAATALGLLVACLVRTESQVSSYANVLVITMAGISGCFMPRDWLPDIMKQISLATPHAWSLNAYSQILTRAIPNQSVVFQSCGILIAFALMFYFLGALRFGKVDK